ncbi:tetraacyldisaccharide 4'-kinase [Arenimonas soli]|uniref:Tetraacyldisaccharide 4'-kinase n=1 Tax=Arenimonas soli TaxID=2269504 RepID=A0ABQ1HGV2_9GAMM|nr:tetraacyldisaccharide 4'-kinase [Arenimonas soli]
MLQRWYGGAAPGPVLKSLALVYGALVRRRQAAFASGERTVIRLPVPVLVIGNLVAGGAGKTPLAIGLARALARRGWKPGIASRGHGRRGNAPTWARPDSDPADCGDEPLLIARQTGLPVAVDRDRVAAARRLVEEAGCNLVIADDGLQHLRLGRDIEIEVRDGERRLGNGRLLPAGPLREPAHREVDFRVINGGAAAPGEWRMDLRLGDARPLGPGEPKPLGLFAPGPVHGIAGIGNPARFFRALRGAGLDVLEHAFPDHHSYQAGELEFSPPAPRLMTEKDAVKCDGLGLRDAWAVPAVAELPAAFVDAVHRRLAEARREPNPVPAREQT